MALPPTIPTSFVPHPGGNASHRYRSDFTGAFAFFAYGVLALVVIVALGIFFYGRILVAQQNAKDQQLAKAEAAIDPATVEGFVQLRDRLDSGAQLLDNHVAFTNFFSVLETLLPSTVRFTSLHLSLDDTGTTNLAGEGTAKDFNALAAASTAFAKDGRIKDAIFSHIVIKSTGAVTFTLSATLDPKLTAFEPSASTATAPAPATPALAPTPSVATTAPATVTSSSTTP